MTEVPNQEWAPRHLRFPITKNREIRLEDLQEQVKRTVKACKDLDRVHQQNLKMGDNCTRARRTTMNARLDQHAEDWQDQNARLRAMVEYGSEHGITRRLGETTDGEERVPTV